MASVLFSETESYTKVNRKLFQPRIEVSPQNLVLQIDCYVHN